MKEKILKRKIGDSFLLLAFALLFFSGCFSPYKGDEATLTLLFGGAGGRAIILEETLSQLVYTVELEGPTGRQSYTMEKGAQSFNVTVTPGHWNITLKAYLNTMIFAEGSISADIKAGPNTVEIKMNLTEEDITINIPLNDEGQILDYGDDPQKYDNIVVYKNVTTGTPGSFEVKVKEKFTRIEWLIFGSLAGTENTFVIKADAYGAGTYLLVVSVIDEFGVPYSAGITFTVKDY